MTEQKKIVMEYSPPWRVQLTYFKDSGKFYTEGEYMSKKLNMFEIFEEVEHMLAAGSRPGLVSGRNEFYAVVNVPDHPHNHPFLIVPERPSRKEKG